jgi:hypothetical protein
VETSRGRKLDRGICWAARAERKIKERGGGAGPKERETAKWPKEEGEKEIERDLDGGFWTLNF